MSQFYRVLADPKVTIRWYLKAPLTSNGQEVDSRVFTIGKMYDGEKKLKLPLRRKGKPIDFNFGDFDMIVTPKRLNDTLQALTGAAIQRIPVEIETSNESYEILNVLDTVECISVERSEFTKWGPEDGRPDKVGQFRMITKLFIEPEKANAHKIFRLLEWKIALIVSDSVKNLLEEQKVTGVVFQEVN